VIESKSTYEEKDNLFSLFDVLKTDRFKLYNYSGSLTTPDCQQIVTWMVSPTFIPITSRELAKFRKIKDEAGEPIKENFRPIQLLNGRSIAVYRK
jgi:carbonic anhydrase